MPIDVDLARALTPGCANVTHLNNAGASLSPQPVLETVIGHLQREAAIGGYEAAAEARDRVEQVYDSVARLLGAHRDEIALVENATRAWDMAFYSLSFEPGDRILTGRAEYASNMIALLQVSRKTGAVIEVIDDDEHGQIDLDALERAIDERTQLIALTHVPTSGGLVNPAEEVGRIAKRHGITYLLDACQSAGQLPLDVAALGCDFLSATGRKFLRAPRGTGFLYVRRPLIEQLEPVFLDLHAAVWTAPDAYEIRGDARRFENWESNVATRLGLGTAVDHALGWGLPAIEARVVQLAQGLRARLGALPGVGVTDLGRRRCGIVTFSVDEMAAADVQRRLQEQRINTSVSLAEYAQLDLPHRGLPSVVRASVHYFNTDDELDRTADAVAALSSRS